MQRALLDHDDGQARQRQDLGRDAAAGAAADDDDVGGQRAVGGERGAVDDLPAARQAGLDRVGNDARALMPVPSIGPG
jgi:hypothetical protein